MFKFVTKIQKWRMERAFKKGTEKLRKSTAAFKRGWALVEEQILAGKDPQDLRALAIGDFNNSVYDKAFDRGVNARLNIWEREQGPQPMKESHVGTSHKSQGGRWAEILKENSSLDGDGLLSMWDNPLFALEERLEMAKGGVIWRDKIIKNLRSQLAARTKLLQAFSSPAFIQRDTDRRVAFIFDTEVQADVMYQLLKSLPGIKNEDLRKAKEEDKHD